MYVCDIDLAKKKIEPFEYNQNSLGIFRNIYEHSHKFWSNDNRRVLNENKTKQKENFTEPKIDSQIGFSLRTCMNILMSIE